MEHSVRLFIVGVGRSGTSLVQSMLDTHEDVSFAPETGFVRRWIASGRLDDLLSRGRQHEAVNLLLEDRRLQRLGGPVMSTIEALAGGPHATAQAIYEAVIPQASERGRATLLGDKDPRLLEHLPLLACLWPEAHVVHVIRDPRDVLASKKEAAWARSRKSAVHVIIGAAQRRLARKTGPQLFGHRYHEVRYEQLLHAPHEELSRLCAGLGIPFSETMVHDFASASERLVARDELDWKGNVLRPLLTANSGKWRGHLTPQEVALVRAFEGTLDFAPATDNGDGEPAWTHWRYGWFAYAARPLLWALVAAASLRARRAATRACRQR